MRAIVTVDKDHVESGLGSLRRPPSFLGLGLSVREHTQAFVR
jgi:hypothetical protein